MKHNNKKAFTIIELVIVIAVIGILAAILIPTFMSLTSRSKQAATEALITNLNKIMMIEEVEPTSSTNMTLGDALDDVSKNGYTALGIANNDTLILWDQKTNRFIKEEEIPNNRNKYEYWCFSSTPSDKYSTYLLETSTSSVNTSLGIDVGDNINININFSNSTTLDDLRIRTNKGNLTISSNSDSKIYQYGSSDDIAMNTGKLYLYGNVDTLKCNSGDTSIYSYGSIDHIIMNNIDAHISIYNDKLEALAYNYFYTGTEPSNIEGIADSKIYHYYCEVDTLAKLMSACTKETYILFKCDIANTNDGHSGSDKNIYITDRVFINGNNHRLYSTETKRLLGVDEQSNLDIVIKDLILSCNKHYDDPNANEHKDRGISVFVDGASILMKNVTWDINGTAIYIDAKDVHLTVTDSSDFRCIYAANIQYSDNIIDFINCDINCYYSGMNNETKLGYIAFSSFNKEHQVTNNVVNATHTKFLYSYDGDNDLVTSTNILALVYFSKSDTDLIYYPISNNVLNIDHDPSAYDTNPVPYYFVNVNIPEAFITSNNRVVTNGTTHYYGE